MSTRESMSIIIINEYLVYTASGDWLEDPTPVLQGAHAALLAAELCAQLGGRRASRALNERVRLPSAATHARADVHSGARAAARPHPAAAGPAVHVQRLPRASTSVVPATATATDELPAGARCTGWCAVGYGRGRVAEGSKRLEPVARSLHGLRAAALHQGPRPHRSAARSDWDWSMNTLEYTGLDRMSLKARIPSGSLKLEARSSKFKSSEYVVYKYSAHTLTRTRTRMQARWTRARRRRRVSSGTWSWSSATRTSTSRVCSARAASPTGASTSTAISSCSAASARVSSRNATRPARTLRFWEPFMLITMKYSYCTLYSLFSSSIIYDPFLHSSSLFYNFFMPLLRSLWFQYLWISYEYSLWCGNKFVNLHTVQVHCITSSSYRAHYCSNTVYAIVNGPLHVLLVPRHIKYSESLVC